MIPEAKGKGARRRPFGRRLARAGIGGHVLRLQGDYDLMERRRRIESELETIAPRAA